MNKTAGYLIGLFGAICLTACRGFTHKSTALSVYARMSDSKAIVVELTNHSKEPIQFRSRTSLPWEWRYAILVKAFEANALGTEVEEVFPISDPPHTENPVTLMPNEAISGIILLESRFPQLDEALKDSDVVLFWYYRPDLLGSVHVKDAFGVSRLSRAPSVTE